MKRLLIVTSVVEGATGLALMAIPSMLVSALLGTSLTETLSIILARVAGSALFSLALAAWLLRKNAMIPGLIVALLFYNIASIVLLGYAGLYEKLMGVALWPAVAAHIIMTIWCAMLMYSIKK